MLTWDVLLTRTQSLMMYTHQASFITGRAVLLSGTELPVVEDTPILIHRDTVSEDLVYEEVIITSQEDMERSYSMVSLLSKTPFFKKIFDMHSHIHAHKRHQCTETHTHTT